jgi:hypothetical protein
VFHLNTFHYLDKEKKFDDMHLNTKDWTVKACFAGEASFDAPFRLENKRTLILTAASSA